MRYIQILSNSGEVQTALDAQELGKPYLAYLEDEHRIDWNSQEIPEPVYSAMPLTFEIISGGTINWKPSDSSAGTKSIQYKVNEGEWEWTQSADSATTTINVNAGDKVQIRGFDTSYTSGSHYWSFCGSTAVFEAYGNIMSLIDSTGYTTATTLESAYTFFRLFSYCSGLTSAENLILPATTLATDCYYGMFYYCTSLTQAPELPATTLAPYCYESMFWVCTNLTSAPALPATTLANNCYRYMFNGCTSLTSAPELPATTLTPYCYSSMFYGCTSLTQAPELPATTLVERCYYSMFEGCTSLTTAPKLPATTLVSNCYRSMFSGCTSLNYVKCLATSGTGTGNWLAGVSSTGTFVKHPNKTWATGASGIPTNWTVQNAVI